MTDPTPERSEADAELGALDAIVRTLGPLSHDARVRVIAAVLCLLHRDVAEKALSHSGSTRSEGEKDVIKYSETKVGDILKIVGAGAPGYAQLGDLVRVTRVDANAVQVEDKNAERVEFLYNCGAARLDRTEYANDFPEPVP